MEMPVLLSISSTRVLQIVLLVSVPSIRVFCLGDDNPTPQANACKKTCTDARMPPAFTTPVGQLDVFVTKCVVHGGETCQIDFGPHLQRTKAQGISEFYLAIVCKFNAVIRLQNNCDVQRKNVISYLHMAGSCQTSIEDVARFGNATDYRVQLFTHGAKLNSTVSSERTTMIQEIQNIGSLVLQSSYRDTIPTIYTNFNWPLMAEVAFINLSISTVPRHLRYTMPRLQALELNNNSLIRPPDFPWDEELLHLPRNLSRTAVFNNHYQQGTVVKPNVYRRFLILDFNNIEDLSTHEFRGFLHKVSLKGNGLKVIGSKCFRNLTGTNIIDLSSNKLQSIPEGIFRGMESIIQLRLDNNKLSVIPDGTFKEMKKMKHLYLHGNKLTRIQKGLLSTNEELVELRLQNNRISVLDDTSLPENSNTLKILKIQNNQLKKVPSVVFLLRNLETADMSFNNINFKGFMDVLDSITVERLLYNLRESASTISGRLKSNRIQLNLANNRIESINLENLNLTQMVKLQAVLGVFQIDLRNNPLKCDCKILALGRMVRQLISKHSSITEPQFDSWLCATPKDLKGKRLLAISEKSFLCVKNLKHCPKACTCSVREIDGKIIVDCREKGLRQLPDRMPPGKLEIHLENNMITELSLRRYLVNVTTLHLSRNHIKQINTTFLSELKNITVLTIDNNKLKRLPARAIQTLTTRSTFSRLSLHHNFFTCDCHARWMKTWLINATEKIHDINSVLCTSGKLEGKPIYKADDADFICTKTENRSANYESTVFAIIAIVLGVLLAASVIIFVLVYCFRGEMKIFMYTQFNWHPFDRIDDSDTSKIYDTFISYSSHDKRWVLDTLKKTLEEHEPPYQLCLHDRDFEVGATIHENILNSVNQSKRMIMVLSNDFIASEWCRLEFRAAHQKVLEDKTNYLIIILFDDVNTRALDDETKLYLRTNTYLSISNKWFWDKLFYSLPLPRSNLEQPTTSKDIAIEMQENVTVEARVR